MKINGTIKKILSPISGTSARGEWIKQEVIITYGQEYPKDACVSFWGDSAHAIAMHPVGSGIEVEVNIESREHNDRWFTEVRAWRFAVDSDNTQPSNLDAEYPSATGNERPSASKTEEDDSDLPF